MSDAAFVPYEPRAAVESHDPGLAKAEGGVEANWHDTEQEGREEFYAGMSLNTCMSASTFGDFVLAAASSLSMPTRCLSISTRSTAFTSIVGRITARASTHRHLERDPP
jgi:hypothetical protein